MSLSKANELLQQLVENCNRRWNGKGKFTSQDAYILCKKIVEEYEKKENE